jgi:hypothetical protein
MKYSVGFLACLILASIAFNFPAGGVWLIIAGKLPILLSVVLAAIFVRLARGFPPIPYDKIKAAQALTATAAFRKLVKSYLITVVVILVAIVVDISVSSVKIDGFIVNYIQYVSFTVALVNSFVILALYSLILSDVIISNIQADLIDEVVGQNAVADVEKSQKAVQDAFKVNDGTNANITKL